MENVGVFDAEEQPRKGSALFVGLGVNLEAQLAKQSRIIFLILSAVSVILSLGCTDEPNLTNVPTGIQVVPFTYGMPYLAFDNENATIDLGEVGVYESHSAIFEVRNTTTRSLEIESIDYVDAATTGERWGTITWRHDTADLTPKLTPFSVPGQGSKLIEITFAPQDEGEAQATLLLKSNATDTPEVELHILATGIYLGRPDIEISYNGQTGPVVENDCTDETCTMVTPLDFGNIGLGTQSTALVTLRNTANCFALPNTDPCTTCSLQIMQNPENENLGLGFRAGTNEHGRFTLASALPSSLNIPQADIACGHSGEIKILLTFTAPDEQAVFEATLVVESNDPEEAVIEIPIRAQAKNAPVAIAELRECGTIGSPEDLVQMDCSDPDKILPLRRVHLQGTNSYDPAGSQIITYQWEIIDHPMDSEFNEFDWQGQNDPMASFWVPLVGSYTVLLTVQNESGVKSGVTEQAKITFEATPESSLHVQLTWDNTTNDQDLHLTHTSAGGHFCSSQADCFYTNKLPLWFDADERGEGANPRLDIDDTNGLGPENINIDRPRPGTYRVFVHYYPQTSAPAEPTANVIRIYVNGLLRFSEQRVISAYEEVWAAAEVTWFEDGSEYGDAVVQAFPNPAGTGVVGSIASRDLSQCGSPTGWIFPGE